MRRMGLLLPFGLVIVLGLLADTGAQPAGMKRTAVLDADMAGMQDQIAHMWVADIPPGAATGVHRHPTPRFVYVISGAVTLEIDGQAPRTFKTGEGFQEVPDVAHNFRNASGSEPARALGFQIAGKGQALQY